MNIIYSVIIPHRNTPNLLNRCIASVPQRSDVQTIVIDDNSDVDKKPQISREDIEVVFLNNIQSKGAGKARNVGLTHAKGQWLIFADADDYFTKDFWEKIDDVIIKNEQADIIYYRVGSVDSETYQPADRDESFNMRVDNYLRKRRYSENFLRYMNVAPWGKMIRNKLVQTYSIEFEEVPVANDIMFSIMTGHHAKVISASDITMYVVTKRRGSLVTQHERDALRCRFEVSVRENAFLRKIGKTFYEQCLLPLAFKAWRNLGFSEMTWYLQTMLKHNVSLWCGYRRRIVLKILSIIST